MFIPPGTRIGAYEIAEKLGEGGMGVVYAAIDTRLRRRVAMKFLPESLAPNHDRLARFHREAEALAALNHPNIAAVYGLEEAPSGAAIVMELVEGSDLSLRLRAGPVPVSEALRIARQLAQALEAAHARGVVHRDIKPANIKLQSDGTVKVLDFGLAKMASLDGGTGGSAIATVLPSLTTEGVVVGTVPYMSPEQLRGEIIDKRTDVWAFGCVVYEVLTGTHAFGGASAADVGAAILGTEPDWSRVPAVVSRAVRELLAGCLAKDAGQRVGDLAVARFVLEHQASPTSASAALNLGAATPISSPGAIAAPRWRRAATTAAAIVVTAAITAGVASLMPDGVETSPVTRTMVMLPPDKAITLSRADRNINITPDGTRLVYVGPNANSIMVRALDALDPVQIASVSGARGPFVSPDGQWVGFIDNQTLKKVPISGGPITALAFIDGVGPRGATWMPDDTIIFATSSSSGLQRVSAAGGTIEILTQPDAAAGGDHLWPEALPGGRAVLFTITESATIMGEGTSQIAVLDLATRMHRVLIRGGTHAQYAPTGHIVYVVGGTLHAVGFDLSRLELRGEDQMVIPRLVTTVSVGGNYSVGANGTLLYVDAPQAGESVSRPVWVDRRGAEDRADAPPAGSAPRFSPDGTRIAVQNAGDAWLWDSRRSTFSRLSVNGAASLTWTADGRRIVFGAPSERGGLNLWWQRADGSGLAERLSTSANVQAPTAVTPDGTALVFMEASPDTGLDIMRMSLVGDRRITPLVKSRFTERNGTVSPDGVWLTYESDMTGRFEVYAKPIANLDGQAELVSTTGGFLPRWARDGRDLYYLAADGGMMRLPVEPSGTEWRAGAPVRQFDASGYAGAPAGIPVASYDISSDGQRLMMVRETSTPVSPQLIVVQNWTEELRRLVPID